MPIVPTFTRDAVARQVGLAAIDLPAGQLDEAFLMSLASANLAGGPERFKPTQVLIGRYARLQSLLHIDGADGFTNVQGVGFSSDSATVSATVSKDDGSKAFATWADEASSPHLEPLPSATGQRIDVVGVGDRMVIGADASASIRDGRSGPIAKVAGSIVDFDPWSGAAWVSDPEGRLSFVSASGTEPLVSIANQPGEP